MENRKQLMDYLNNSRQKRRRLVGIANVFFEKVVSEEQRKIKSRDSLSGYENSYNGRRNKVILEPIAERVSQSRALVTRNRIESFQLNQ